jgi:hypothetical protein
MRFTLQQTEGWQRDVLAAAADDLTSLVWFIQLIMPHPPKSVARTMTQAQRQDYRYRTACWPGSWVPYIEVAPDPTLTRIDAELLAGLFAAKNPSTMTFAPALALRAEVTAVKSYEYGQPWDLVCSRCGGVFTTVDPVAMRLCAGCEYRLYRMAMY